MIKGIQVFGIVVGFILLLRTYANYKRGHQNLLITLFWITLSSTMIILFYNTSYVSYILPIFTTQDTIMTVVVTGILVQFILISNLHNKMLSIEKKFTEFAQAVSISNYMRERDSENT